MFLLHQHFLLLSKEAAGNVTQAMLEKAINTVAAKRSVEFERELNSSIKIKDALDEAIVAEDEILIAHGVAKGAEDQATMLETYDATYEDTERLRDLSVAHAAHRIEKDVGEILKTANAAGANAMNDFLDCERSIQDLESKERLLKVALEEFLNVKRERAMARWGKSKKEKLSKNMTNNLFNTTEHFWWTTFP
jgi:hypothetical protein